jgi:DNA-directed RNA polymerase specialized sigma24 family protein
VTDATLVAAVADGDPGALRELYERHGAWLHARCSAVCNDSEVVVEVVQDTFLALWKDARRRCRSATTAPATDRCTPRRRAYALTGCA